MNNLSRLLNPEHAGDFLGMTGRHVRRLASAGVLPCYHPTPRRYYFDPVELAAWVAASRSQGSMSDRSATGFASDNQ